MFLSSVQEQFKDIFPSFRVMVPGGFKSCIKNNKHDVTDAEAICEAVI